MNDINMQNVVMTSRRRELDKYGREEKYGYGE
jgi:hypothetical protein